jgi:methionine synthase II (cobalamin-independent)
LMIPKVTTIGSYPTFPRSEDVEYYYAISRHGLGGDVVDPYFWAIEEALKDFTSAGVDVPSTGQSRGDLYSLFLEPKFVKGIAWQGADAFVTDKIERVGSIRLADVLHARGVLPRQYELKEPITDAYTLARYAKITTSAYADTRELAKEINKRIIIPEIEDLQASGAVSWLQLDSPTIAAESSTPHYVQELYEEVASVAKLPVVVHVCGDAARIFASLLTKLKVQTISLDFYHYPKLFDEAAKKGYDQTIGLGCTDSQSPRVETIDETDRLIAFAETKLGSDRIQFVHPHCGQRNLNREVAYEKNVVLTLARDEACFGKAEEASAAHLTEKDYDPKGYFLVSVSRETKEIVVTYYTYEHVAKRRFRSRSAERLFQSLNDEADHLGLSRRHLAYLTLELGRAEASLAPASQTYRQKVIE